MYYNHNLRVNLKEWRNRVMKSSHDQFNNSHKYFFDKLRNIHTLLAILSESTYIPSESVFEQLDTDQFSYLTFDSEEEEAVYKFHWILFIKTWNKSERPSLEVLYCF